MMSFFTKMADMYVGEDQEEIIWNRSPRKPIFVYENYGPMWHSSEDGLLGYISVLSGFCKG